MDRDHLSSRAVWFFDCDGVLLNSNSAKSSAFHTVALRYGADVADNVLSHHMANGGLSRFIKLERIFSELLQRPPAAGEYEELLSAFGTESRSVLAAVDIDTCAPAVLGLLAAQGVRRQVVSGGEEREVAWALQHHELASCFEEIHGSPRTKADIIASVLNDNNSGPERSVMVGDSLLDLAVAAEQGLERVFVSHWTEFAEWRDYVAEDTRILVVTDLCELHRLLTGEQQLDRSWDLEWVPLMT